MKPCTCTSPETRRDTAVCQSSGRLHARLLLAALAFAAACSSDAPSTGVRPGTGQESSEMLLVTSADSLATRMRYGEPDAEFVDAPGTTASVSASPSSSAARFTAASVAQATPPAYKVGPLPATHILLNNDRAYVAYASPGADHVGAVDVFDISNRDRPVLISTGIFPSSKILSLALSPNANTLYLATATIDANIGPAVVEAIQLNGIGQLTPARRRTTVPSYAATGIVAIGTRLFATSGNGALGGDGGLHVLDATTMKLLSTDAVTDARAVSASASQVAVVAGTPGRLRAYSATGSYLFEVPLGGLSTRDAKAGVGLYGGWGFASLGAGGAAIVRMQGGAPAAWKPFTTPVAPTGGLDTDAVTNAIVAMALEGSGGSGSCSTGVVLTADGNAGIRVWQSDFPTAATTAAPAVSLLGSIPPSAVLLPGSSNMVGASASGCAGNIFIANGLGGLRVYQFRVG